MKNIRMYFMVESSAKLVVSLCLLHLDFSNSILPGLPDSTSKQMQRIQNYGAKLVLVKTRYCSSNQVLTELHWLPIKPRIKFKILMIVCKCLKHVTNYLRNLLVRCSQTTCTLRSNVIIDRLVMP